MANSSPNERPRSLSDQGQPGGAPEKIGVPKKASEWEGGAFLTNRPRKEIKRGGRKIRLSSEKTDDPRLGDRLYIWISESYGGKGLTACARASRDAVRTNSGLSITVSDVELLLAAGIDRNRAKRLATPDNVFDDILASTSRTPLRWISGEDAREIERKRLVGIRRAPPSSAAAPDTAAATVAARCRHRACRRISRVRRQLWARVPDVHGGTTSR